MGKVCVGGGGMQAHTLNGEGVCGGRGYALCDHLDEWWVDLHETEHLIKD